MDPRARQGRAALQQALAVAPGENLALRTKFAAYESTGAVDNDAWEAITPPNRPPHQRAVRYLALLTWWRRVEHLHRGAIPSVAHGGDNAVVARGTALTGAVSENNSVAG